MSVNEDFCSDSFIAAMFLWDNSQTNKFCHIGSVDIAVVLLTISTKY